MSFGTVSFEELLGHCNEVLKKNRNDISDLQDHLYSSSSYIPPRSSWITFFYLFYCFLLIFANFGNKFSFVALVDFDEEAVVDDFSLDTFSPGSSDESKRRDDVEADPLYPLNLIFLNIHYHLISIIVHCYFFLQNFVTRCLRFYKADFWCSYFFGFVFLNI